jgi:hypothetical protein
VISGSVLSILRNVKKRQDGAGGFSCIAEAMLTTRAILKDRGTAARPGQGFSIEGE